MIGSSDGIIGAYVRLQFALLDWMDGTVLQSQRKGLHLFHYLHVTYGQGWRLISHIHMPRVVVYSCMLLKQSSPSAHTVELITYNVAADREDESKLTRQEVIQERVVKTTGEHEV
jgi:hypothetical protein